MIVFLPQTSDLLNFRGELKTNGLVEWRNTLAIAMSEMDDGSTGGETVTASNTALPALFKNHDIVLTPVKLPPSCASVSSWSKRRYERQMSKRQNSQETSELVAKADDTTEKLDKVGNSRKSKGKGKKGIPFKKSKVATSVAEDMDMSVDIATPDNSIVVPDSPDQSQLPSRRMPSTLSSQSTVILPPSPTFPSHSTPNKSISDPGAMFCTPISTRPLKASSKKKSRLSLSKSFATQNTVSIIMWNY